MAVDEPTGGLRDEAERYLRALAGEAATLRADQRVRPDQELVREVCRLCGDDAVQLEVRA